MIRFKTIRVVSAAGRSGGARADVGDGSTVEDDQLRPLVHGRATRAGGLTGHAPKRMALAARVPPAGEAPALGAPHGLGARMTARRSLPGQVRHTQQRSQQIHVVETDRVAGNLQAADGWSADASGSGGIDLVGAFTLSDGRPGKSAVTIQQLVPRTRSD
jgi:hypothetical protein